MPVRAGCVTNFFLLTLLLLARAVAAPWVTEHPQLNGFALVADGHAAAIIASAEDFKVVQLATADLAADIQRVTGLQPNVAAQATGPAVLVGTLGHSALIDGLVAAGRLDLQELRGAWESFVITTVADPLPGVPSALVIAGSDRRGTAYGIYELSQAIGVSPWYWWADVTPARKTELHVAAGTRRFGPPSVQYRGIFLNDEDWGLQPWAAKTFEPETGDIGPKTYAKICELLLRLKANTLWPAMHACTKAFNLYPRNKQVADDYAIVMGSSHAEPMLRNNVTEWTAPHEQYDYVHHREQVQAYWEERVRDNGRFENIYTLGMRGIHDSNMIGPKTDAERIATLEQIFADQRELIARYARWNPASGRVGSENVSGGPVPPAAIPQMFCAYKEVLALYRQGLKVPDDVTIVWPDDNFGYIRNFASAAEQQRAGGFGVYYHLSYLGAPLSYLWLSTTPPALIHEEMTKAYAHGARKLWIANVGDLKPAEIGTEFFLQLAWDIQHWNPENLANFLPEWATREFGPTAAPEIAAVMGDYYRLNFARRPEHLQWWLPGKPPQPSPWSPSEISTRLADFVHLRTTADRLAAALPVAQRDAFDELVGYPVRGSALANLRYFAGERGDAATALAADAELRETTRRFNEEVAGGKWRGFIALEPASAEWKSMRIAPWAMPDFPAKTEPKPKLATLTAGRFDAQRANLGAAWVPVGDLGVTLAPATANPADLTKNPTDLPRLDYAVDFPAPGEFKLTVHLLPTHPLVAGRGLRVFVGLDDITPMLISYDGKDGSADWAQGVLANEVATKVVTLGVAHPGRHTIRLYGCDAGVVVRRLVIE